MFDWLSNEAERGLGSFDLHLPKRLWAGSAAAPYAYRPPMLAAAIASFASNMAM